MAVGTTNCRKNPAANYRNSLQMGEVRMNPSFVSPDYRDLQLRILQLQNDWQEQIPPEKYTEEIKSFAVNSQIPLAAQIPLQADSLRFSEWVGQLASLLIEYAPQVEVSLREALSTLDVNQAEQWIEEGLALNPYYFAAFAKEHQLPEWLPQFLAEHALRPYLRVMAKSYVEMAQKEEGLSGKTLASGYQALENQMSEYQVGQVVHQNGCPVCGEPVRLAQLAEHGEKVIHCPRCEAHWQEKRLKCSHCGNEDHETIHFLAVEDDPTARLHVCEQCSGYVKVIDTKQYLTKPAPSLLDLDTVHLDFVAQENGFGEIVPVISGY